MKWKFTVIISACLAASAFARRPEFHFTSADVAKVHINPKYCSVLDNGDLECNKVRVVLATIPAK